MKYLIAKTILLLVALGWLYLYPYYAQNYSSLLIVNNDTRGKLPRSFRMTPQHSSGSGQFSEDGLKHMLASIPSQRIIIIDLREESHGFLNGDAISWYGERNWLNKGKSRDELIAHENEKLAHLKRIPLRIAYKNKVTPVPYWVRDVENEEAIVKRNGASYYRLPVRDHTRPCDQTVEKFVEFVKHLDPDDWLHMHCSAGKGRSTTFLALYDMMLNARSTPLEEIIHRQYFYGGVNLFVETENGNWKAPFVVERMRFLERFYNYCIENPEFTTSWTAWISSHSEA